MRKLIVLIGSIAALVVIAPAATADRAIVISSGGFNPRNVTITAGDTVTWSNTDSRSHQIVVERGCTITVQPGTKGTCSFRTVGTFNYRDPARSSQTAWRGTITVRAAPPPPVVTIAAAPPLVTYPGATTLAGTVSTRQANERVTVRAQPCGSASLASVATVSTTANGAWTLDVRPQTTTAYEADLRGSKAKTTVMVRPRVTVRKLTRGRFVVRVSAAQDFTGKVAVLQRYRASSASWGRIRYVSLSVLGGTEPTVIAGATVATKLPKGTRVRAVIGPAQAGPCYAKGTSNIVRR